MSSSSLLGSVRLVCRTGGKCALAILVSLLCCLSVWGQADTVGTVTVNVTDPSGAGVPGANLEIKDISTNVVVRAQSQQNGTYTFPSLNFGTYTLTVTKDGFETQIFQEVQVQTGRSTTVNAKLKVGTSQQTVTVTGESPLIETNSNVLSDTIDTKQVVNLPLSGRNMFPLALLVPGWASN